METRSVLATSQFDPGIQDMPVQSSVKEANQISGVPEENHALLPSVSLHPYAGETLLNNKTNKCKLTGSLSKTAHTSIVFNNNRKQNQQ
jgi:hypothetical protein